MPDPGDLDVAVTLVHPAPGGPGAPPLRVGREAGDDVHVVSGVGQEPGDAGRVRGDPVGSGA
jgi:hypothetical protein